jgi:hypothetical protein
MDTDVIVLIFLLASARKFDCIKKAEPALSLLKAHLKKKQKKP